VFRRVDVYRRPIEQHFAGQRIELGDALDFIAPELNPQRNLLVGGKDVERIAAHTERTPVKIHIIALELQVEQLAQQFVAVAHLADTDWNDDLPVLVGRTETVDRRHRRHDQNIAPGEERLGGGVAQPVDLFVDLGFLFDVQVFAGHIRFRRVDVVVGNKHLNRRIGQQFAKLGVQLADQRLVVRHDQRRSFKLAENVRHGQRFTGAGCAEQRLMLVSGADPRNQLSDRFGLIARRLEGRFNTKRHASGSPLPGPGDNARLA